MVSCNARCSTLTRDEFRQETRALSHNARPQALRHIGPPRREFSSGSAKITIIMLNYAAPADNCGS